MKAVTITAYANDDFQIAAIKDFMKTLNIST